MDGFSLASPMSQKIVPDSPLPAAGEGTARSPRDEVLGLTVHSLPDPAQPSPDAQRTQSGRWKMILVMLLCASPVVASYLTYYVIRPEGRRNFGELIEPQRPLPDSLARQTDGKTTHLRALKGQWLLVSIVNAGGGPCDAACAHTLYLQRQLHTSLGKERDKVDRVLLLLDDQALEPALRAQLGDVTILNLPQAVVQSWLQPAKGQVLQDHLYLVDPLGNWMMRFPPQIDLGAAAKVKRDLDRLLRAAASWDAAGRP